MGNTCCFGSVRINFCHRFSLHICIFAFAVEFHPHKKEINDLFINRSLPMAQVFTTWASKGTGDQIWAKEERSNRGREATAKIPEQRR